jgi:hypothetical protein
MDFINKEQLYVLKRFACHGMQLFTLEPAVAGVLLLAAHWTGPGHLGRTLALGSDFAVAFEKADQQAVMMDPAVVVEVNLWEARISAETHPVVAGTPHLEQLLHSSRPSS